MTFRETDHLNVMKVLGQCVETMPYLVVLELCPFVSSKFVTLLVCALLTGNLYEINHVYALKNHQSLHI